MSIVAFQAYATGYGRFTADTPRAAALGFFAANPRARKCAVIQGTTDGHFFTVAYSRGNPPESYRDVTKSAAQSLRGA